jgi:hypothetical protein
LKISTILFAILSIICLVLPRCFGADSFGSDFWETPLTVPGNNFLLLLCLAAGVFYLFCSASPFRRSFYPLLLTIFFLIVLISSAVHLTALSRLPLDGYVTVDYHTVEWAQHFTNRVGRMYMTLPLLFLAALLIWRDATNPYFLLLFVPLLFLPSCAVAAYQYFFDRFFLAPTSSMIFGLSAHGCAIGISVYFLSIIAFAGIWLNFRNRYTYLFIFAFLAMVGTHFLQTQQTVQIGWLLLAGLLPRMYLYAAAETRTFSKLARRLAHALAFGVVIIAAVMLCGKYFLSAHDVFLQRLYAEHPQKAPRQTSIIDDCKIVAQKHDSARIYYAAPAIHMFMDAPLIGWGPAGYQHNQLNYQHRYNIPAGPIHNAADYYLQLLADLGLLGCLVAVFIHLYPLWMVYKIRNRISGVSSRLCAALLGSASAIWLLLYITGPHVDYLEVLWPYACIQAVMVTIALQHGYQPKSLSTKTFISAVALAATLYGIGCLKNAFSFHAYNYALKISGIVSGGYHPEWQFENNEIKRWIWTSKNMQFKATAASDYFMFLIAASPHNSAPPQGLTVTLRVNGNTLDRVTFINGGTKSLLYYVPGLKDTEVLFSIHASKTFKPSEKGETKDSRELGVMLLTTFAKRDDGSPVLNGITINSSGYPFLRLKEEKNRPLHFRNALFLAELPEGDCGFYTWETWDAQMVGAWPKGVPLRLRWTGMRASMPIPDFWKHKDGALYVYAGHPDLNHDPVMLTIYAGGDIIKTVTFAEQRWLAIPIASSLISRHTMVTFQVNRTWNPRLTGQSSDSRDLGVAIAIPPQP